MSSRPWALVSPASRGIGFALVQRLLKTTNVPVVATARSNLEKTRQSLLNGLPDVREDRLHVVNIDFLEEQSVVDAATELTKLFPKEQSHLRLAFSVPGILYPEKSPSQINYEDALHTFQINTLGPMLLLKYLSDLLPRQSTNLETLDGLPGLALWAMMSARVGSITDNRLGGWYSYRASKAAVAMTCKTFDHYLRVRAGEKAMSIALHPGTVKTDLSKEFWNNVKAEKLFSADFAAEKLMDVVNSRTIEDRGVCFDWKGEIVPP